MPFVALITDAASRYAHVYVPAQTWKEAIDILEDGGLEVVEDQSEDYEFDGSPTEEELNEIGVMTVDQLLKQSDAVFHD